MSNNVTRKGIAFGALVALASTGIAGAPAFANDLSLAPAAGETYNVLLSDSFTLQASVAGLTPIAQTNGTLKYEIVNASGATLVNSAEYWTGSAYANATATTTGTSTQIVSVANVTQTLGKVNKLTINPTTTSTSNTFEVVVRAFADLDGSGSVTSGDLVSAARTVKFVKGSEVTGTLALDPVNAGVAPTASLTFSGGINYSQTAAPTAAFTTNGTAATAVTGVLDADTEASFGFTAGATATAGQIISAKATWLRFDGDSTGASATSATNTVSAASTATVGTATVAITKDVANTTAAARTTNDVERVIRAGVKTVTVKVAFKNGSTALGAGAPVSVQVTREALASGDEVTVGTKTVKSTVASATYFTSTNASGEVEIPVTAKNGGNGTNVTITVISGSARDDIGLIWQTAAATSLIETKAPLGYATRVVAAGANVDLAYVLVDQFKQAFTRTDYNYRVQLAVSGTATITSPIVALTNGAGSATIVANSTDATDFNVTATAWEQTGTGAWSSVSGVSSNVTAIDVATIKTPATVTTNTILIGTQEYSSTVTTGATANAAGLGNLADKDLVALDRRVDDSTAAAIGFGATVATKLSGRVTAADGSVVIGTPVKISAAGQAFSIDATGSTFVAMNEITVFTNASGDYEVFAFSKTAGTVTYTTAAGAATKTQDVKYAGVTTAGAGSVLTVAAPAVSQAGRAVDVTAKLVDKFGNPISGVEVKFTLTGAGYLTTASANTAADGSVATKIVVGVNDLGDAVVTATTTIDGKSSAVAKTVNFGLTDGYIDILNGKRASVTWSMAKGKRVAFLLNGVRKYNFVQTGDAELNLQFNLRKGTHNIKLVIGGVIVDDINVKITK